MTPGSGSRPKPATDEPPWAAGRLATSGQAIVLEPPADAEVELIAEALERVEVGQPTRPP